MREYDLEEMLETLQLDPELDLGATLRPEAPGLEGDSPLPEFKVGDAGDAHFRFEGVIGRGGMGEVLRARQVALNREVAVKVPRDDATSTKAKTHLLREAFVTGWLEHPNIVPVYQLGTDPAGKPLMVMKRVEGVLWSDVLHRGVEPPDGEDATLAWNVRVLMAICDAIRFAHRRGIVHRDIKPDNVMVGEFGEVYLLDWGIAISVEDDGQEWVPGRARSSGLAGTPAYMAPEMTMDDALDVDFRTDVYLIGSCIHEVLTGEPPHHADTMIDAMRSAIESTPRAYAPSVPEEIAGIARRAMSREKEDRFASAGELKKALQGFLDHRASSELTDVASATLRRLETEFEAGAGDEEIHERILDVRSSFKHALSLWEGNERAQVCLERALVLQARRSISLGEVLSARSIVKQLNAAPQEIIDALEELEHAQAEDAQRLIAFDRVVNDMALKFGSKGMALGMLLLGGVWTYAGIRAHFYATDPNSLKTLESLITGIVRNVVVPGAILGVVSRIHFKTPAMKRIFNITGLTLFSMAILRVFAYLLELNRGETAAMECIVYGLGLGAIGEIVDRRLSLVAAGYFAAGGLVIMFPWERNIPVATMSAIMTLTLVWVWMRGSNDTGAVEPG